MNWNGDQEPGLFVQHQCLTSQMFYWLNRQKFPLVKRPSRRVDAGCMGEQLCISMYLEYDVIKVLLLVIVRSPNTFVHIWAKSYFARTLVKNDKYIKVYIFYSFIQNCLMITYGILDISTAVYMQTVLKQCALCKTPI